jgi:prolipoprotein diacylglyceryltransferase
MIIVAAAFSLLIPFTILGSVAAYFPAPFDTIVEVLLIGIGFPVFLGFLHARKVFSRGIGSVFFTIYTWFYLLLGLFSMSFGYLAYETPQYDGIIVGVVLFITGCALIWWSRKTDANLASAIDTNATRHADAQREEQIQIQAEAIARAEQMKNSEG